MVLIYTGNGKGKTSAAMGFVLRTVGYKNHVAIVQFFKNTGEIGEWSTCREHLSQYVDFYQIGKGFYQLPGDSTDEISHIQAAEMALEKAKELIASKKYFAVILDEVNVAVHMGLVKENDLIRIINETQDCHLLLTGRDASEKMMECADLVTEMKEIKHPFQKGLQAIKGIDY